MVFETQRTRCLYAPWATQRILEALPWLRITADFSHFTNVAENPLMQPPYSDMMDVAIERADHIHARVGRSQAAQVADPRVGSGLRWTERFERRWDRIIEARKAEGRPFLTINPASEEPLADLWDVCL